MATTTECTRCGVSILPATADRTGGLCAPCKGGWRESVEAGKRWYREERERQLHDPLYSLWRTLVHRVYSTPSGFEGLSSSEKLYFAVRVLVGDVYNGGFMLYFDNAAPSYHDYVVRGLAELGAVESLGLVEKAGALLRSAGRIDTPEPQDLAPALEAELRSVDERFWADPDGLDSRLEQFAMEHHLVA